ERGSESNVVAALSSSSFRPLCRSYSIWCQVLGESIVSGVGRDGEKTPLLASALLLPQTDLGGDLYSNRRRELIDAMTALPCLTAAVFSSQVELRA
ncbi:hypothetical protein L195_g015664, partial [Trifolium pratense]